MENTLNKLKSRTRILIICVTIAIIATITGIIWYTKHENNIVHPGIITGNYAPSGTPSQLHNTSPSTSPCPNDTPPLGLNIGGQTVEACSQPVDGTISAISATNITVTPSDGSSAQVFTITSGTKITQQGTPLTTSDIKIGDTTSLIATDSNANQAWYVLINPHFQ